MSNYNEFLDRKAHSAEMHEPIELNPGMFPFQKVLVDWAIRKGRAAIFADCGLGKTLMELSWANNVVRTRDGEQSEMFGQHDEPSTDPPKEHWA